MAKKPQKTRRGQTAATQTDSTTSSIFTTEDSSIIPGEVILRLQESAAAQITESIVRGPRRGRAGAEAASFGITALDSAISDLGVSSIVRLHPPAPVFTESAREAAVSLASTFRLTFDAETKVEKAVDKLSAVAGVEYA